MKNSREYESLVLRPIMLALKVQARVLHALVLREVRTAFGRHRLGYLWAILEPLMYVGVFFGIFKLIRQHAVAGIPLLQFIITGIVPFLMFQHTLVKSMSSVEPNRALLTFPQVTPLDLIVAKATLEIATLMVVFVLLFIGCAIFSPMERIENPIGVAFWFAIAGILGAGSGAFFSALASLFPVIERLVPPLTIRPLFFISGIFFTIDSIPETFQQLALINPILHIIELIRSACFPAYHSPQADPWYTLSFTLFVVFLGLVSQRAFRKRLLQPS